MWSRPLALVGTVAVVSACSPAPAPDGGQGRGDLFALRVEVVTTSWALVQDEGDGTCGWTAPSYVLQDGAGVVLDVGDLADDEGAAVGQVRGSGPDASCVLAVTLDVPVADVYALEVTTTAHDGDGGGRPLPGAGETFTGAAMISRADAADEALTVPLEGPAPVY